MHEIENKKAKEVMELYAQIDELVDALEKIGDATSAMKLEARQGSYADWELRIIAREALAKQRGVKGDV